MGSTDRDLKHVEQSQQHENYHRYRQGQWLHTTTESHFVCTQVIIDVAKVGETNKFTSVFVINKVIVYMHLIYNQLSILDALGTALHLSSFNRHVVDFLRTCNGINACSHARCIVMGASTPLIRIWTDNIKKRQYCQLYH